MTEFLKTKLKLSQDLIKELDYGAEALFSLEENIIDYLSDNMTSEEKSHIPEYFSKVFEDKNKSARN